MVENTKPKIIVLAMGDQTTEQPPIPIAVGNKPTIVVKDVNIIGLSLVLAASTTASLTKEPFALNSFIKLIKTIASFTAIPAKATLEQITVVERGVPETKRYKTTPIKSKRNRK